MLSRTHLHTSVRKHTHTGTLMCTHVQVHVYTYMNTMHIYMNTRMWTHVHTHTCTHILTRALTPQGACVEDPGPAAPGRAPSLTPPPPTQNPAAETRRLRDALSVSPGLRAGPRGSPGAQAELGRLGRTPLPSRDLQGDSSPAPGPVLKSSPRQVPGQNATCDTGQTARVRS